jgi:3D-(3,5/4)-trihydroxycyclohexane-1,2-dione acylhydrolase (decyclizing)
LFEAAAGASSSASTRQAFDAPASMAPQPLARDARQGWQHFSAALAGLARHRTHGMDHARVPSRRRPGQAPWTSHSATVGTAAGEANALPTDAQVIGAVQRSGDSPRRMSSSAPPADCPANCTSSGAHGARRLPYGIWLFLHGLRDRRRARRQDGRPSRDVIVMVGDGSYLMMNSEIATSVMLGLKLTIVVLDNRGFGCINRLQQGDRRRESFNNLLDDCVHAGMDVAAISTSQRMPRAIGAHAEKVRTIAELEQALYARAKKADRTSVIVHRHGSR